jgi:YHS domain-containing protein
MMRIVPPLAILGLVAAGLTLGLAADGLRSPRQAMEPFGVLVGTWKGTGTPAGTKAQQSAGFWIESLTVSWKFKKDDAWLVLEFDKSKHFKSGRIKYVPMDDKYRVEIETIAGKTLELMGELNKRTLTADDGTNRLVVTMLHDNRFLYQLDAKPEGKTLFSKVFGVGATKEGVAFAVGDGTPECIVTGGAAKTPVSYKGTTYYVCCSGCRDEFLANPEKYIKEAAEKKAKK